MGQGNRLEIDFFIDSVTHAEVARETFQMQIFKNRNLYPISLPQKIGF